MPLHSKPLISIHEYIPLVINVGDGQKGRTHNKGQYKQSKEAG